MRNNLPSGLEYRRRLKTVAFKWYRYTRFTIILDNTIGLDFKLELNIQFSCGDTINGNKGQHVSMLEKQDLGITDITYWSTYTAYIIHASN